MQVTIERVQLGVALRPVRPYLPTSLPPSILPSLRQMLSCQSDCKKCKANEPKHNATTDVSRLSVRQSVSPSISQYVIHWIRVPYESSGIPAEVLAA